MNPLRSLPGTRQQAGVSLVSLMIGLLLGLMSVLAAVSLFRTQTQQARTSQSMAKTLEAQTLSLQVAELEIQRAGFGLEDSDGHVAGTPNIDFVLLSASRPGSTQGSSAQSLSGTRQTISATVSSGNAVLWRWRNPENGAYLCAGLIGYDGGLQALTDTACTQSSDLASQAWPSTALRSIAANTTRLSVDFKVQSGDCSPYGHSSASASLFVTLTVTPDVTATDSPWNSTDSSQRENNRTTLEASSNFCLTGIRS